MAVVTEACDHVCFGLRFLLYSACTVTLLKKNVQSQISLNGKNEFQFWEDLDFQNFLRLWLLICFYTSMPLGSKVHWKCMCFYFVSSFQLTWIHEGLLFSCHWCHHWVAGESLLWIRHQPHMLERRRLLVTAKDSPPLGQVPLTLTHCSASSCALFLCGLRWRQTQVRGRWEREKLIHIQSTMLILCEHLAVIPIHAVWGNMI